jgi:hypothetical protein
MYKLNCLATFMMHDSLLNFQSVFLDTLYIIFVCVGVMYTQVNIMFVLLLWVCIHTGQDEKFAWPRWESNPRPLGY